MVSQMNREVFMKLLSGRLWLTFIAGVVFAYATYAKIISGEAVASILTGVIMSYFNRHDRRNGESSSVDKAKNPPPSA